MIETTTKRKRGGQGLLENSLDAYQFRLWWLEPETLAYQGVPS